MCGLFGIRAPERDVARVSYFGLFALQHRGQESAGIAVSDAGTPDRRPRHGACRAGLLRADASRPRRPARDRPHALLDDRLDALGERPAARPPRPRANRRSRAQREPDERRGAPRGARGGGREARVELGLRGDRGADRERPRPPRRGGRPHARASRRCDDRRRADRGEARRVPRPVRLPAARRREPRRRLGAGVRELRARPRRRRAGPRAEARRARRDRRRGPDGAGRPPGGSPLPVRVHLPGATGLPARGRRGVRRACANGRGARRRGSGRGRSGHARARTPVHLPRLASPERPGSPSTRA